MVKKKSKHNQIKKVFIDLNLIEDLNKPGGGHQPEGQLTHRPREVVEFRKLNKSFRTVKEIEQEYSKRSKQEKIELRQG